MKRRRIAVSNHTVESNLTETTRNTPGLSARNKKTIHHIPVEIMVKIIKLVLGNYTYLVRNDWRRITITHVCRRWRDIAVGAQELWTKIETWRQACPEQTALYLERSGTSKLSVYHRDGIRSNIALESLHLTLEHLPRIRELKIYLWEISNEIRFALFDKPALALKTFSLETRSQQVFEASRLFSGQAPNLTGLLLGTNSPSWDKLPFVETLIRACIGSSSAPVRLRDVYALLSKNSNLKRFWIMSLLKHEPPYDLFPYHKPIQLSSLEDLVILNASYKQLSQLLKNIVFPKNIGWNISCTDYPIGQSLEADPNSIIPRTSGRPATSIDIRISPSSVSIEADLDGIDLFTAHRIKQRLVKYSWETPRVSTIEGFGLLCSVIKGGFWCSASDLTVEIVARAVKSEDLLRSEKLGEEEWKTLLEMLPRIRTLAIRHIRETEEAVQTESHYGVLGALGGTFEDFDTESYYDVFKQRHVVCPELSELHLYGFDSTDRDNVVHLMNALKYRRDCRKWLALLTIYDPKIESDRSFPNLRVLKRSRVASRIDILDENDRSVNLEEPGCSYGVYNDEDDDIRDWRSYDGDWAAIAYNYYYDGKGQLRRW